MVSIPPPVRSIRMTPTSISVHEPGVQFRTRRDRVSAPRHPTRLAEPARRMIHRLERQCVALAFVAVSLLAGLFTLHRFDDLDVCWHLRTGQWILDQGRIPRSDPFAGGADAPAWIDFEWGAQTLAACVANLIGV